MLRINRIILALYHYTVDMYLREHRTLIVVSSMACVVQTSNCGIAVKPNPSQKPKS